MDTQNRIALIQLASIDEQLIAHTGVNLMRWQAVCAWVAFQIVLHGFFAAGILIAGWPLILLLFVILSTLLQLLLYRYARSCIVMNIRKIEQVKEQHDKIILYPQTSAVRGKTSSGLALH